MKQPLFIVYIAGIYEVNAKIMAAAFSLCRIRRKRVGGGFFKANPLPEPGKGLMKQADSLYYAWQCDFIIMIII
jgi:hypothetical protein